MKTSIPQRSESQVRAEQEAKNQLKFIYDTNQTLQNLSNGIISLSLQHEKFKADLLSQHKKNEISLENLQEQVLSESADTSKILGDFSLHMVTLTNEITKKFIQLYERIDGMALLEDRCKKLEEMYLESAKRMNFERQFLESSLITIGGRLDHQIAYLKQELTPIPPLVDPIKQALDERLTPALIDFDGLKKEIAILKKAVRYSEKKFENIYTLIDQLKAGPK